MNDLLAMYIRYDNGLGNINDLISDLALWRNQDKERMFQLTTEQTPSEEKLTRLCSDLLLAYLTVMEETQP